MTIAFALIKLSLLLIVAVSAGAGAPTQILSDELMETYTDMLGAWEQLRMHGAVIPDLTMPQMAVIGMQTAGKSTWVDFLVGFPVSKTDRLTGNRCPVRYELFHDAALAEPLVEARAVGDGGFQAVVWRELAAFVDKHMSKLRTTTGFSSETLVVRIRSARAVNLVVVDMPGLINNPSTAEEQASAIKIEQMVAQVARDPAFALIVMLKATESTLTIADMPLLDRLMTADIKSGSGEQIAPRPEWRSDAVLLLNGLNRYMADVHKTSAANAEFENAARSKMFVVVLKPDPNWKREEASFDDVVRHIDRLEDDEGALWKSWSASLVKDEKWRSTNDARIGVAKARNAVVALWTRSVVEQLPLLIESVHKQIRETTIRVDRAQVDLNSSDPAKLRELYMRFIEVFHEHVLGFQSQTLLRTETFSDAPLHGDAFEFTGYTLSEFGRTFDDDLAVLSEIGSLFGESGEVDGWELLDMDQLKSPQHVCRPHQLLCDDLARPLIGNDAYRRLQQVFVYFLLNREFSKFTDDDIRSFGMTTNGHGEYFDTPKAVIEMVRRTLTISNRGVRWFLAHYEAIAGSYVAHIVAKLTRNSSALKRAHGFVDRVHKRYMEAVHANLTLVLDRWQSDVRMATTFVPVDITVRKLIGLHLSTDGEDADFVPDPESLQNKKSADNAKNNPHFEQKVKRVRAMRGEIRAGSAGGGDAVHKFNAADFVEGGLVIFPPQDLNQLDCGRLRTIARELYVAVIELLVTNIDIFIKATVRAYMSKDEERWLFAALRSVLEDLSEADLVGMTTEARGAKVAELTQLIASRDALLAVAPSLARAAARLRELSPPTPLPTPPPAPPVPTPAPPFW
jgi:hypothetical protein